MFVCLELWQKHHYFLKKTYLYLKMVPSLNFRHRGDKTLKLSSHIILLKTQLCALVFFSRSLNERNMGPNDGTNGSFPPSFQEHGVAPSSGALRRRTLCFAKWSNCFLTRLALKQKCKSVPNHVQPAGFWHLMTQILSKGHNPFKHKSYKSIFKRKSSASLSKIWWNRFFTKVSFTHRCTSK